MENTVSNTFKASNTNSIIKIIYLATHYVRSIDLTFQHLCKTVQSKDIDTLFFTFINLIYFTVQKITLFKQAI